VILFYVSVSFSACTQQQLSDELTQDPSNQGYQPYINTGDDKALVGILNQVQQGASFVVNKGTSTLDSVRGTWGDVILLIDAIANDQSSQPDKDKEAKWRWNVETLLLPVQTLDYSAAATQGFFAQAIADGLLYYSAPGVTSALTQEEVDARIGRQGSRAEVVCGTGTVIKKKDVSKALRGLE
jgi:hypothetical protein